jgi:hypothetical protein
MSGEPLSFLPSDVSLNDSLDGSHEMLVSALADLQHAVRLISSRYFRSDVGTWPDANDWTAAFTQTSLTAVMKGLDTIGSSTKSDVHVLFAQIVASYFGQDALSIRYQVSDDDDDDEEEEEEYDDGDDDDDDDGDDGDDTRRLNSQHPPI